MLEIYYGLQLPVTPGGFELEKSYLKYGCITTLYVINLQFKKYSK